MLENCNKQWEKKNYFSFDEQAERKCCYCCAFISFLHHFDGCAYRNVFLYSHFHSTTA
jgi:hypothetical protein